MATITDIKKVYPEFKSFKDVYTRLKVSEKVLFTSDNNKIILGFNEDSPFYRLYGEWDINTEFGNWIKNGKSVSMSIDNINLIAKCLKKNALSIDFDSDKFTFNFNDKDANNVTIDFINDSKMTTFKSPFKSIDFLEIELDTVLFEDDLIRIYRNNDTLTTDKIGELLIEVPRTSLLSFQPKSEKVKIRFTKNSEVSRKYVEIETTYEGLTLTQLFATI